MTYVLRAVRLHLIGRPLSLLWPWGIMASSWAINWLIFAAMQSRGVEAGGSTGGLLSLYVVQVVIFVKLFTSGFQFAVDLSLTRRAYYVGTWIVVLALSFGNAVVLTVLKAFEGATGGWGVHLPFFGVGFMQTGNPVTQVLAYAGPFVLSAGGAAVYGLIGKRWGTDGVYLATVLSILVPGLFIALVTWQERWTAVGHWVADQSAEALFAVWPGLVAVVCAAAGFLVARRASF